MQATVPSDQTQRARVSNNGWFYSDKYGGDPRRLVDSTIMGILSQSLLMSLDNENGGIVGQCEDV